ncbi:MAG: hypothetical protein WBW32_09480 [Luteibacter sp.]
MLTDDSGIPIPVDDFVREAWELQVERALVSKGMNQLCDRLAECFAASLAECLDPDLRMPSEAQVRYATVISRDLGVPLPAEALRFRGPMGDFIERFAALHRARRQFKPMDD